MYSNSSLAQTFLKKKDYRLWESKKLYFQGKLYFCHKSTGRDLTKSGKFVYPSPVGFSFSFLLLTQLLEKVKIKYLKGLKRSKHAH